MPHIIPIRPAVQNDVRVIRKGDSALLVDAATNRMVECDWEDIAEYVVEGLPLVYPAEWSRWMNFFLVPRHGLRLDSRCPC